MQQPKNLTPVSQLGEFGLISRITRDIVLRNPTTIKGAGDDAAVIECGSKCLVFTTDMLTEGIHFDLVYFPLKHLGYKSAVVNFSDICAMNGVPKQITVSIGLSSKFSVEAVEEMYSGINAACEKYGVDLVGGDTVASASGLVISIAALGEAVKEQITYRNTAGKNDLICVSGDIGASYMGLLLLQREKKIFLESPGVQPDFSDKDYLLRRHLLPEARADIIRMFQEFKIKPTSMIDISDGLSSEILHLCHESGLGCTIYEDKIPMHPVARETARELNLDSTMVMLNGGEDYELLFTISQSDYEKIKDVQQVSIIGHMTDKEKGCYLSSKNNVLHPLTAQGWDAFLKGK
ncbi:MAG: thiamine-phosphate kinase [Bacteroidetes bacterium]|nr:thiamine-phosphate kinase [Bacteroidota bacterium]